MFNRYILDSDTFQNLNKRRELRKKLAKQMILNAQKSKQKKLLIYSIATCSAFWLVEIHANLPLG